MFAEKKQNLFPSCDLKETLGFACYFRYETIGLVGLREYKTCKAAFPSLGESYLLVNPKIYGG